MVLERVEHPHACPAPRSPFEQRLRITNRNAKIGASKTPDHRKGYPDDLPILVNERSSRASGSGLRIIDNLIGGNIADMPLRDQRTDELAADEFVYHSVRISSGGLGDLVHGFLARTCQHGVNARCVTEGDERFAADSGLLPRVRF